MYRPATRGGAIGQLPPEIFTNVCTLFVRRSNKLHHFAPPPKISIGCCPAVVALASEPYSVAFASRSENNYDVTEAQIANKFVVLDFYVAAFCNFGFTICGSHIEQVWPPLL